MKRNFPLMLTFLTGFLVILSEFIPRKPFSSINSGLEDWFMIVAAFSILLGLASLFQVCIYKIRFREPNWQYYILTMISFWVMVLAGVLWGNQDRPGLLGDGSHIAAWLGTKPFVFLFDNMLQHLSASMFALLAFFIASAAYRAFIARSPESMLLLAAALLVMLGRTSFGFILTRHIPESLALLRLPELSSFISEYLTTAGQRAIMISSGLGVIGSSLRILLGIERSYLGGD